MRYPKLTSQWPALFLTLTKFSLGTLQKGVIAILDYVHGRYDKCIMIFNTRVYEVGPIIIIFIL